MNNHVKPHLGEKPLRKVTATDLRSLYEKLLKCGRMKGGNHAAGLSPTTVRSIHNIIHHALRTAAENGLLPANPADGVTPPKIVRGTKSILNQEQLDTFKAAVKQDWVWQDFFLMELTTGLRRGELCGLKWSDFDEEAGTVNVCRTIHARKGGGVEEGTTKTYAGTRTILLPSSTAQLLRERKKSALTEWAFPDPLCPEKPVSPGSAYRRLKGLLEDAGLPDLRFHDLRHTFATNALEHGIDIKTLSAIIGHVSSATTLNVYAHMTDEMRQKAADRIDRGIAGVEPRPKAEGQKMLRATDFQAVKGKYRKPGTGCITKINDHLWEGQYSPKVHGKRIARNVYASTEEACEQKLAELIVKMKKELAPLRVKKKAG